LGQRWIESILFLAGRYEPFAAWDPKRKKRVGKIDRSIGAAHFFIRFVYIHS
jgi:hypothetical protein